MLKKRCKFKLVLINALCSFEDGLFPVHICILYQVLFGFTGNLQLSPYVVTSTAWQYLVYSWRLTIEHTSANLLWAGFPPLSLLSLLARYSLKGTYKLFDLCTAAFGAFLLSLVFFETQDTFEFLSALCTLVFVSCHCSTSTPISHTVNHSCPWTILSTVNHLWIKRPVFGIII